MQCIFIVVYSGVTKVLKFRILKLTRKFLLTSSNQYLISLLIFPMKSYTVYSFVPGFCVFKFLTCSCLNWWIIPFNVVVFRCMDVLQFIHSPVDGRLDCFQLSAIKNNAAINIPLVFVNICFNSSEGSIIQSLNR